MVRYKPKSMTFVKKTNTCNVYPNKYVIGFTKPNGVRDAVIISALTGEEAVNIFRSDTKTYGYKKIVWRRY